MIGYGQGTYGGGLYGGADRGVQLLPEIPDGTVTVEIAWGADLTDTDGSGWTWTDITSDVRIDDGLSGSLGRNDEASNAQPAKLSMKLDNSLNRYSLGGHSPNYPNVRRNTPVRVQVDPDDGGGDRLLFQGYAVGFTPGWDVETGRIPVVTLEAAGVLRRLSQGKDPLRSSLYRFHTIAGATGLVDYWPLEEDKAAYEAVNAGPPGGSLGGFVPWEDGSDLRGKIGWGADDDNPATERAATLQDGGSLHLPIRGSQLSQTWALTWSMRYTSRTGAGLQIRTNDQTGAKLYYGFIFYDSGTVEVYAVAPTAGLILSFSQGDIWEFDQVWHDYALTHEISGGSVITRIYRDGVLMDSQSAAPGFRYQPTRIEFNAPLAFDEADDPISVAHVAAWDGNPDVALVAAAAAAHVGETPEQRLTRLCAEHGVELEVVGTTQGAMGPQQPLPLLALLREAEAVDQGILYDGAGPGLRYVARDQRENAAVDLTIPPGALVAPFEPVDDDQRTVNRCTASARSGAKYTAEDVAGPMGTAVIGVYDSSLDVNLAADGDAPAYADWAVHLGTREGYRYPSVSVDLRSTPNLAPSVLALEPSARLRVTDPSVVISALPAGDVDLLVEGLAWSLSPYGWRVTAKCSPFGPWVIGLLAEESDDDGEGLVRLRTDGASTSAPASAEATTLSVATASGPLWTTVADDFPLYLDVAGVKVRATACSGSSSPQTFTVDPLPQDVPAGAAVDVWDPPGLGL